MTNEVTERAFWVGCYPGLTDAHLDYVIDAVHEILAGRPPAAGPRVRRRRRTRAPVAERRNVRTR